MCDISGNEAEVVTSDALDFLRSVAMRHGLSWDIAFFDPPYVADYERALEIFGKGAALRQRGGVLVAEHHCDNKLPDAVGVIRRWRTIRQGDSCLSFYERKR